MSTLDLNAIRADLERRAAELRAEVQSHREQLEEPGAATGNTFIAGVEGAIADSEDERELALIAHLQRELDEVGVALARVDSGDYGICDACGSEIAAGRLKARPQARLCLGCQEAVERSVRRG